MYPTTNTTGSLSRNVLSLTSNISLMFLLPHNKLRNFQRPALIFSTCLISSCIWWFILPQALCRGVDKNKIGRNVVCWKVSMKRKARAAFSIRRFLSQHFEFISYILKSARAYSTQIEINGPWRENYLTPVSTRAQYLIN